MWDPSNSRYPSLKMQPMWYLLSVFRFSWGVDYYHERLVLRGLKVRLVLDFGRFKYMLVLVLSHLRVYSVER